MATSKKSKKHSKKNDQASLPRKGPGKIVRIFTSKGQLLSHTEYEEGRRSTPVHINPESKEEREKRLAARKTRTIKAFQSTYENHHRRRAS